MILLRGLGFAKASVFSPPICSFLKEIDDGDVLMSPHGHSATYIALHRVQRFGWLYRRLKLEALREVSTGLYKQGETTSCL